MSGLYEASSLAVISSLSLDKHKIQRLGMTLTGHKNHLLPYLPPVSLYMSLTVRVDISVNGFPLRPPVSFLCSLFKVSGLATVVFVTMIPSTPP